MFFVRESKISACQFFPTNTEATGQHLIKFKVVHSTNNLGPLYAEFALPPMGVFKATSII